MRAEASEGLPEPAQDARFPRAERLGQSSDFRRIHEGGRVVAGRLMVLKVLRDGRLGSRRAGVVASRKVGGAVERNRARRRLRELYRTHRCELPRAGLWLMLIARAPLVEAAQGEVEREFVSLLRRGGLGTGMKRCAEDS